MEDQQVVVVAAGIAAEAACWSGATSARHTVLNARSDWRSSPRGGSGVVPLYGAGFAMFLAANPALLYI